VEIPMVSGQDFNVDYLTKEIQKNMARAKAEKWAPPKGYEERGGNFPSTWEPEIGDVLEGTVRDYKTVKTRTRAGQSDLMVVREKGTNLDWSVWISAGLKGRVEKKDIGKHIFLRRVADVPSKKRGRQPMKGYWVGFTGGK
jgi:hypothetical protein